MRHRPLLVKYLSHFLRLSGVPALVAIVVIKAASLSSRLPFGGWSEGIGILAEPWLYPVWIALSVGAVYIAVRLALRCTGAKRLAFLSTVALSTLVVTTVLAIDLGCGAALHRHQDLQPDLDVPAYAYLATESLRFGDDNTLSAHVRTVERLCTVYNVPYAGTLATGYGLAVEAEPVPYRSKGAFGKAQYLPNGLLAEGYVFSLDVALNILETYYRSRDVLEASLDAYNRAMSTAYATVDEALDAVRAAAQEVRRRYYSEGEEQGNGAKKGDTWDSELRHAAFCTLSATQIHALLSALFTDAGNSALLSVLAPLSRETVSLDALLETLLGAASTRLRATLDTTEIYVRIEPEPLSVQLSGGPFGDGISFALGKEFDETPFREILRGLQPDYEGDYPLSALLARALRSVYGYTPREVLPLFAFYTATAPADYDQTTVGAFLSAAAEYDFALFEGKTHGKAVSACLMGNVLGDGTYPATAGLNAENEVRAVRWQIAHLTPVLSLLVARNALLCYGGVAVAAAFLSDFVKSRARSHEKKRARYKNKRRLTILSAVCLALSIALGLGLRLGVMPIVHTRSFGVINPAAIAASPIGFTQSLREEEARYLVFALLSGQIEPDLAYECLSEQAEGIFCDQTLQSLYFQAAEGDVLCLSDAHAVLYDTLWRYYVLPDRNYGLALTPSAEAERRAYCTALTAYLYPTWQAYIKKGVRLTGDTPIDTLFRQEYYRVTEKGYLPLRDCDALYLTLTGRESPAALLHLALDHPERTVGSLDAYGEPIALASWDTDTLTNALADFPDLLDAIACIAAEDLSLPATHRVLATLASEEPRMIFSSEEGRLTLWVYPSSYRAGGVGYVQGTLVRYRKALYVLAFLIPFGYFLLLSAPLWALVDATTLFAPRRPKRVPRPPHTRPPRPRAAKGTACRGARQRTALSPQGRDARSWACQHSPRPPH